MIWCDVQLGPAGSPRPDVYTIDKSFAKFRANAYEVKSNASDLRRDITAGKWQNYLKYAHAVWFALPAALAKREDVPAGCGIIAFNGNGWRTVRRPVINVLTQLPRETSIKLLIKQCEYNTYVPENRSAYLAEEKALSKINEQVRKLFGEEQAVIRSLKHSISHYNGQLESYKKQYEIQRDAIGRQLNVDIPDALQELGRLLGAKENTAPSILRALRDAKWRLKLGELDNTIKALQDLKNMFSDAQEKM